MRAEGPAHVQDVVSQLRLQPHPEGGWYRRIWTAPDELSTTGGSRAVASSILFLLDAGGRSRWHRVHRSQELWLWLGGGRLVLETSGSEHRPGPISTEVLGPVGVGATHHLVRAGQWQRAKTLDGRWSLVSCVLSPEFSFEDFELLAD
ncbi:MAG: cupin domain-containing protein [Actinomycetes bacterium]